MGNLKDALQASPEEDDEDEDTEDEDEEADDEEDPTGEGWDILPPY